jgi:hypothetical protein
VGLSILKHGIKQNANTGRPQQRSINYNFFTSRCDKENDTHKPSIAIQFIGPSADISKQPVSAANGPDQL